MAAERIEYSKRERNIPPGLHESWKKLRKRSDVTDLIAITGKSKPVIYAALKNGYVADPELVEQITHFYLSRATEVTKVSPEAEALIQKTLNS